MRKVLLRVAILVAALVASVGLTATAAAASPSLSSATVDERDLPRVPDFVSADELAAIGQTQDLAEIEAIVSLAGPDQAVQLLLDFESNGYGGAVLVDAPPALREVSSADKAQTMAGIGPGAYGGPGMKGASHHTHVTLGWYGAGSWSGSGYTNWNMYVSGISTASLVGPSNLTWRVCPGWATCTVSPAATLGYVSFD